MAGLTKGNAYNFIAFWVSRIGSNGIATGQLDPDGTLTPDTASHALLIQGDGIASGLPDVTRRVASFGGAEYHGKAAMGIGEITDFTLEFATNDRSLKALLMGGNVDTTTISGATISGPNSNNPSTNEVVIGIITREQSRDSGTDGANKYKTWIVPRCQATYYRETGANLTDGRNPQPVTVEFAPTMATKLPWGTAFGSNQGWYQNKEIIYDISGDYWYTLTYWTADGTETDFDVGYKPESSDVTSGNTTNVFAIDGTVTAPTSISTSTGNVVIAAAGSSADQHVAFYATLGTSL